MKTLSMLLDQLTKAQQFLQKPTDVDTRLALVLSDNVAELLMYLSVTEVFAWDRARWRTAPPRYSNAVRRRVIREFPAKVRLLRDDENLLSPDDSALLEFAHELRNEAYHRARVRERIFLAVTRSHFAAVCRICPTLWSGSFAHSGSDELTAFAERFQAPQFQVDNAVVAQICQRLSSDHQVPPSELANVLADDLRCRVSETIRLLNYLAAECTESKQPDDWFRQTELFSSLLEERIPGESIHTEYRRRLPSFTPSTTSQTLEDLRAAADTIGAESALTAIVASYRASLEMFEPIEEQIGRAAFEYDMHVDGMIHG